MSNLHDVFPYHSSQEGNTTHTQHGHRLVSKANFLKRSGWKMHFGSSWPGQAP